MREDVIPYDGSPGRVVVYDTYANDGAIHFDVMILHDEAAGESESNVNRRALAVAKSFLEAFGADPSWVKLSGCSRCHVDELERYKGKLWFMSREGAWIWPLEGCPKPRAGR